MTTLTAIFDSATALELEDLINANPAPKISAETLSAIKAGTYGKLGFIKVKKKKTVSFRWRPVLIAAACLALIAAAFFVIPMFRTDPPDIPDDEPFYSASFLSGCFPSYEGVPETACTKVIVPDAGSLKMLEVPRDEYVDLYRRNTSDKTNIAFMRVRRLPLEEAEKLLYKGYVFGGHSCYLCTRNPESVSFEGYDRVGIEYMFRSDAITYSETVETGIPFYVFFKEIETDDDGNLVFAKTYVPAIYVSGLDEYFERQRERHPF